MRLQHFESFAPLCPVCVRAGRATAPLVLAHVAARTDSAILEGTLHCTSCQHEYPVLDGIPIIVPDIATVLAERGVELLLRDDLDVGSESLLGDAFGPDSWFDVMRQVQSTYGWDAYADLDPRETPVADGPVPGAARRCLAQLLALCHPQGVGRILDVGCAAGRTAFALADAHAGAMVLGVDIHLGLLRLAQRAAGGTVSYPRRRIGLVYDRRRFAVDFSAADRVDFWACDALALPFRPGIVDLCVALNVIDCVANPRLLLEGFAASVRPGGHILLATPYDWSARATPLAAWLGGHSQRAEHAGAGEAFFHALLTAGAQHVIPGLACLAEQQAWPWQTRLHDRSAVHYRTHLAALVRHPADAA